MRHRRKIKICLSAILIVLFVEFYYSTSSLPLRTTLPILASSSLPLRTTLPILASSTLPPSEYIAVEMNDRVPSFKLATIAGRKPYADVDRAQATVVDSLQLVNKCKQDQSLTVVDVGAYLGSHTLYLKKRGIIK